MPPDRDELFRVEGPSLWERIWESSDFSSSGSSYWLTRFLILRLLGLVYFVGFCIAIDQGLPLLGEQGLLPAADYLDRVSDQLGSSVAGFVQLPSLFWLNASDGALMLVAWLGAAISLVVLLGYANGMLLTELWLLYMSIVHVGQDWYAFGWEIQLLETGFLAIFLVPFFDGRPFPRRPPPLLVIWLYRWLIFRIMVGAGLIKLRGDTCWTDLTCLIYHYETQPIPNPLSSMLHFMPAWFHKLGVLFNHFCELVVPFFAFGPRRARHLAGLLLVSFQIFLILSGNLSFLNWLTIVPALACFDDSLLRRFFPRQLVERVEQMEGVTLASFQRYAVGALTLVVVFLSINPVGNLLSDRQVMNSSFDPLHLVNTYGAFGSVGRVRQELLFEGTLDDRVNESTEWRAYQFKCKPGDLERRPCWISPYHYRLDWLAWFAAMGTPERYPWSVHLVAKLLEGDEGVLSLFAENPFPEGPPRRIRVQLYRYQFSPEPGIWWRRSDPRTWIPPLALGDIQLTNFLEAYGWLR